MLPHIGADGSELWKVKDMSKIEDLKTLERLSDWSFSTPYKGTLGSFKDCAENINTNEVQLDHLM